MAEVGEKVAEDQGTFDRLRNWTKRLMFHDNGPMTRELLQRPADFGLGKLPTRLAPDKVATSVCGFCSTGCSLNVHLKDGQAVNISPRVDYPVNVGMACPKGWEALTP